MRRSILLALTISAVFAASASASIPTGKYTGTFGKNLPMSFTVKNGRMLSFTAHPLALCFDPATGADTFELETFYVPSAKIVNGKVSKTYTTYYQGQVAGRDHLTGNFNGGQATGTLSGTLNLCTIAKYTWTAHH